MKTDVIHVTNQPGQIGAALVQVDKLAAYKELPTKKALHIRLLTEEMMGLMRSITGEPEGRFWIEDDGEGTYQLHLLVITRLDSAKREMLLSTATSGKNEAATGLMGRLRDFFERGGDEDVAAYSSSLVLPGMLTDASTPLLDWEWSMTSYEDALSARSREDAQVRNAWDELERSVVAHVAKDVKVSIRGAEVEMTVYYE